MNVDAAKRVLLSGRLRPQQTKPYYVGHLGRLEPENEQKHDPLL
jgi:hypothetical protein